VIEEKYKSNARHFLSREVKREGVKFLRFEGKVKGDRQIMLDKPYLVKYPGK
jgi:hypothetical protein